MNHLQHQPAQLERAVPVSVIDVPLRGQHQDGGFLEYWYLIRRHAGVVLLAAVLGGICAVLLTLSDPRIFQARASLEIQGLNNEFLNMGNVNPTVSDSGYDTYSDIQTHVRVMKSRPTIDRTIKRLEAQPRPSDLQPTDRLGMWRQALNLNPASQEQLWEQALGTAAGSMQVRASGTNRIVEVSCDSTNPKLAADFCNTVAQEYIDLNLESRWQSTEYTGQWLTKQLQDLKVKLGKSEEDLQSFVRQTGLVVTSETNAGEEGPLANIQRELSIAQSDRITKQSKYEMTVGTPVDALPDMLDDPVLKESQSALTEILGKVAQLEVTFTPNHAEVRKAQAQASAMEKSLEATRANILRRVRNDYQGAQRREALLASAYTQQARQLSGQAEELAHYNLLKREVDASRQLYDNLLQKLKEASIASALRATNIRVIDAAEPPGAPYKPNVTRQGMIGLLLGMLAGIGLVVGRDRMDRTLQNPGDPAYYLRIPELGVVPVGKLLNAPELARSKTALLNPRQQPAERMETISWRDKNSLVAESYRTTLTSILFARNGGAPPQVIVFTSASPKDGKTTTVCNLAIALAEINRTVLIIDGDMRRPRLHSVFEVPNDLGLSDLLLEQTPLTANTIDQAVVRTRIPGLSLLPSGTARRNASNLLHSGQLAALLTEARGRYDTVLIDAPPLINISDARVLGRLSDGVIIVVRSGVTTRDAALMAKERIAEDGIPILGSILNFWNPKKQGAHYGEYYAGYEQYQQGGGPEDRDGGSVVHDDTERESPRVDLAPQFHRTKPATEFDS